MRIKKKTGAKPFRETMAYRLLLALASFLFFVVAIYEMVTALTAHNTVAFVIALGFGVLGAISIFYNLDRARLIPIPQRRHR